MGNTQNGFTTLARLEKHAKKDYSSIDATYLSDVNVESSISDAEEFIKGYTGGAWTGTTFNDAGDGSDIPGDIELITKQIAKIYLDNYMIEENIGEIGVTNQGIIIDILERFDIVKVLEKYKSQYDTNTGIFISKHVHTPRRNYHSRDPVGWQ